MEHFFEYWPHSLLFAALVFLVLLIRAALIIAVSQDLEYQRLRRKNKSRQQLKIRNW